MYAMVWISLALSLSPYSLCTKMNRRAFRTLEQYLFAHFSIAISFLLISYFLFCKSSPTMTTTTFDFYENWKILLIMVEQKHMLRISNMENGKWVFLSFRRVRARGGGRSDVWDISQLCNVHLYTPFRTSNRNWISNSRPFNETITTWTMCALR